MSFDDLDGSRALWKIQAWILSAKSFTMEWIISGWVLSLVFQTADEVLIRVWTLKWRFISRLNKKERNAYELDVYLVIGLRGRGRGWFIHSFLFVIGSDKKGGRWFDSCNIFVGRKLCRSGIETNEIESCAARVDTMAAACPKSDKKWKKKKSNRKRRIERREERDQVCWL